MVVDDVLLTCGVSNVVKKSMMEVTGWVVDVVTTLSNSTLSNVNGVESDPEPD